MINDKTIKVLLIFSSETTSDTDIHSINTCLDTKLLKLDYVINPPRVMLEKLVLGSEYLFIIPFVQYVKSGEQTYNLIQLLYNWDINYYGCSYIKCLMLNDTYAFLKNVGIGLPTKIITRHHLPLLENDFFPVQIISSEKIENHPLSFNKNQLQNLINEIFDKNKDIEELVAQKVFEYDKRISITIIGNSPYILKCIKTKYSNNVTKNEHDRDANILKMLNKACEIFETFSLRDYAQFIYEYNSVSGKYFLINIDTTTLLNEDIINYFEEQYALSSTYVIYTYILAYLIRQDDSEHFFDIIREISDFLPSEIIDSILPLKYKLRKGNYNYYDICKEMQKCFLAPDESNKYEIISLLQKSLATLPDIRYENIPLLGDDKTDYHFLQQYETLSLHPQNQAEILLASLQILNGQMRWHSPTSLHNVNPPVMFSTVIASTITNLYNPNALEKKTSAGLLKMEQQIIRQLSILVGWDPYKSGGTFTTGGKICMTYAIKCGINRCTQIGTNGQSPIVITSEINHFSVESSCRQLGLASGDCIRIPTNTDETVDFVYFERILKEKIFNHIPIACIIFSGGNTTHCNVEDIKIGVAILNKIITEAQLPYKPFIYYDLVVGWPWLFYKNYDFSKNYLKIPSCTLDKIEVSANKIKYAYLADAIGVDFHKAGFSPNTNSVAVFKNSVDLHSLATSLEDKDNLEPYRYTFSNSRSATSIISAWNALQCAGEEGFQSYIANIITCTNIFVSIIPKYQFEILGKNATYGFATIIWCCLPSERISFYSMHDIDLIRQNNNYLFGLSEYLSMNKNCRFSLRFLPKYKAVSEDVYLAALSILPMTLNLNAENAPCIAEELGNAKLAFDNIFAKGITPAYDSIPSDVPK